MKKEVSDITNICDSIISKSKDMIEVAEKTKIIVYNLNMKTSQADMVEKTLAVRRDLTSLFILNSNFEDNFKAFSKLKSSLENI